MSEYERDETESEREETLEAFGILVRLAEERGVEKLSDLGDLPPLSAAERWRLTRTPEAAAGINSGINLSATEDKTEQKKPHG